MKTASAWLLICAVVLQATGLLAAPVTAQWTGVSPVDGHWVYYATFSLAGTTPAQAAGRESVRRYFIETSPVDPYPLGPLPLAISWPAPPALTTEPFTSVSDRDAFQAAAGGSRRRIRVTGDIPSPVSVAGDDVEVVVDAGVRVGSLDLTGRRVVVRGGEFGGVTASEAEDVLFDGIRVVALDGGGNGGNITGNAVGVILSGRRLALVRSFSRARHGVVARGASAGGTQDIIVAGNIIISEPVSGEVETNLLIAGNPFGVQRSVSVDNLQITAPFGEVSYMGDSSHIKPSYRLHYESEHNFHARNVMINSGMGTGYNAGDDIGDLWMKDNVVYHTHRLLMVGGGSSFRGAFNLTGNIAYSDVQPSFNTPPVGGDQWNNRVYPYETPLLPATTAIPPTARCDELAQVKCISGKVAGGTLVHHTDLPTGAVWHFRRTEVLGGVESGFLGAELARTPSSAGDALPPGSPRGLRVR